MKNQNWLFILFFFTVISSMASAQPTLKYTISFPEPQTHYAEVLMEIDNWNSDSIDIKMATWTPGSYLIREFARKIESFDARSGKKDLQVDKIDKNTWRVFNKKASKISISYQIYSFELSVRTSYVTADQAYLNGASTFCYVADHLDLPSTIELKPYKDWNTVSTGLSQADPKNPFVFNCPNFDLLVDSPIQIGQQKVIDFDVDGVPHHLALIGEGNFKTDRLISDISTIVKECTKVFGDNPSKDYTILLHNTDKTYGGLEHLNSTSLMYPRWSYSPESSYVKWLGLMAHEYFHQWNVKRLKPAGLGPFNYDSETYTTLLWVAEGVTSYFDDYLLRRGKLVSEDKYLSIFSSNITNHENKPGKHVQSVTDASRDTWIKFYRRDENTNNCCVSYYLKGAILSALIDLQILEATDGEKSLGDVMAFMYNKYYKELNRGFTDLEFQQEVEAMAGKSMDTFWQDHIYGTKSINYDQYLEPFGLRLKDNNSDNGKLSFGMSLKKEEGNIYINYIKRGTSGYDAGLSAEDELIALNGYRVKSVKFVKTFLLTKELGDTVEVIVSRQGEVRTIPIKLRKDDTHNFSIERMENPTSNQTKLFNIWMAND